jgi:hypothetical protein
MHGAGAGRHLRADLLRGDAAYPRGGHPQEHRRTARGDVLWLFLRESAALVAAERLRFAWPPRY